MVCVCGSIHSFLHTAASTSSSDSLATMESISEPTPPAQSDPSPAQSDPPPALPVRRVSQHAHSHLVYWSTYILQASSYNIYILQALSYNKC